MMPAFTGVSDPYEPPADADIVVDTTLYLRGGGRIDPRAPPSEVLGEGDNRAH